MFLREPSVLSRYRHRFEGERPSAARLTVRGRVQGVGFRHFVIRTATHLGLVGWVRNLDDGAVEIWAEGDPGALDRLEVETRKGPPASSVREVERLATEATGRYDSFGARWDLG